MPAKQQTKFVKRGVEVEIPSARVYWDGVNLTVEIPHAGVAHEDGMLVWVLPDGTTVPAAYVAAQVRAQVRTHD